MELGGTAKTLGECYRDAEWRGPMGSPCPRLGWKDTQTAAILQVLTPAGAGPSQGWAHPCRCCLPDPPLQFRTAAQACKAGVTLAAQSEKALLRHLSLFPSDTVMQLQQCRARK